MFQGTEVRQAGDDRCDIVATTLDLHLPIEVKCDWHPEIWTAWRDQLAAKYSREPRACGQGIYVVFWFGPDRGSGRYVASAPDGTKPASAAELQRGLDEMVKGSGLPVRCHVALNRETVFRILSGICGLQLT